jgi:hypothetical protein
MGQAGWLRWLTALGSCWLMGGCLFHRPGDFGPLPDLPDANAQLVQQERQAVVTRPRSDYGERPPPPPPPPPQPAPVARLSGAAVPPLERVTLQVGPAPVSAPPPKELPIALPATTPAVPVVAALSCALQQNPQKARQLLDRPDRPDREQLLALLQLAAGIGERDVEQMSPEEVAAALDRLRALARQLRRRAPLTLDKVCFCRRIESFGQYEPLSPLPSHDHCEFQAGSDGQPGERVQVYVEVRNFTSMHVQDHYETRLNSWLEILDYPLDKPRVDGQGRQVVLMKLGTCIDVSQTPRQDYFLNFLFHVPARLPPGLYTLRVTVKDEAPTAAGQKPRLARRSLDFRVCPPGSRKKDE